MSTLIMNPMDMRSTMQIMMIYLNESDQKRGYLVIIYMDNKLSSILIPF